MIQRQSLRGYTQTELKDIACALGEKAFRGKQIQQALFDADIHSWHDCTAPSQSLRDTLTERYPFVSLTQKSRHISSDGTRKYVSTTHDAYHIETVLIPTEKRQTVCVSTQVGCKYGCAFCMSGARGFVRNLDASEIVDQIYIVQRDSGVRVTNVVFMGMGEPFDNYDETVRAVRIMNDKQGYGIGARHITVSTVGIPEGMRRFATEGLDQVKLAISLHAPNDTLRRSLMPVAERYSLAELMRAIADIRGACKRTMTFEYVLLYDVNDRLQDAEQLAALARKAQAKVNLICYNAPSVDGDTPFLPSTTKRRKAFTAELDRAGCLYTIRMSGGGDVSAACGQLSYQEDKDQ